MRILNLWLFLTAPATQVLPGFLMASSVWTNVSWRDRPWKDFVDLSQALRAACVLVFVLIFAAVFATIALSYRGLVGLRACSLKVCHPHLSLCASLAMFLCGQIVNLLLSSSYVYCNMERWSKDCTIQFMKDCCNLRQRRLVHNADATAL